MLIELPLHCGNERIEIFGRQIGSETATDRIKESERLATNAQQ